MRFVDFYINRVCPRNCAQCMGRMVMISRLLKPDEWDEAFSFIEDSFGGVGFYQNLGLESLVYPWIIDWIKMMNERGRNYTIYTTFPEIIMKDDKFVNKLVKVEPLSFSGGVDYTPNMPREVLEQDWAQYQKAMDVVKWISYFWNEGIVKDAEFSITITKKNYKYLKDMVLWLNEQAPGIPFGINIVQWSVDGKHDLYPTLDKMYDYAITEDILDDFRKAMFEFADFLRDHPEINSYLPPKYFEWLAEYGWRMRLNAMNTHKVITLEADGRLRLCLYRAGEKINQISIFDIMDGKYTWEDVFKVMWYETSKCPGCAWNCRWMAVNYDPADLYITHGREWWERLGVR